MMPKENLFRLDKVSGWKRATRKISRKLIQEIYQIEKECNNNENANVHFLVNETCENMTEYLRKFNHFSASNKVTRDIIYAYIEKYFNVVE